MVNHGAFYEHDLLGPCFGAGNRVIISGHRQLWLGEVLLPMQSPQVLRGENGI